MDADLFIAICRNDYRATFAMIGQAIDNCPDAAWGGQPDEAPFWQQAAHAISISG